MLIIAISAIAAAQMSSNTSANAATNQTGLNATKNASAGVQGAPSAGAQMTATANTGLNKYLNNPTITQVSGGDKSILQRRANAVLGNFSRSNFVIGIADLISVRSQNAAGVYIIDVTAKNVTGNVGVNAAGNMTGTMGTSEINTITLKDLANSTDKIPANKMVVVLADDDLSGAVATTTLRMMGINAWYAEGGSTTVGSVKSIISNMAEAQREAAGAGMKPGGNISSTNIGTRNASTSNTSMRTTGNTTSMGK